MSVLLAANLPLLATNLLPHVLTSTISYCWPPILTRIMHRPMVVTTLTATTCLCRLSCIVGDQALVHSAPSVLLLAEFILLATNILPIDIPGQRWSPTKLYIRIYQLYNRRHGFSKLDHALYEKRVVVDKGVTPESITASD